MRASRGSIVVLVILVLACAGLSGCPKAERDRTSSEANKMVHSYRKLMDEGKTTPDQDKRFIRAVDDQVYQLDRAIRGTKKADASRAQAEAIANGIDPNAPLDLNDAPVKPATSPSTP